MRPTNSRVTIYTSMGTSTGGFLKILFIWESVCAQVGGGAEEEKRESQAETGLNLTTLR